MTLLQGCVTNLEGRNGGGGIGVVTVRSRQGCSASVRVAWLWVVKEGDVGLNEVRLGGYYGLGTKVFGVHRLGREQGGGGEVGTYRCGVGGVGLLVVGLVWALGLWWYQACTFTLGGASGVFSDGMSVLASLLSVGKLAMVVVRVQGAPERGFLEHSVGIADGDLIDKYTAAHLFRFSEFESHAHGPEQHCSHGNLVVISPSQPISTTPDSGISSVVMTGLGNHFSGFDSWCATWRREQISNPRVIDPTQAGPDIEGDDQDGG
ncbi:hypothetical protein EV363DRAFT_1293765 [Boletus edulis]|nr:hypothetical protein EV363DRAFT_1293765 [Boletus edulis]